MDSFGFNLGLHLKEDKEGEDEDGGIQKTFGKLHVIMTLVVLSRSRLLKVLYFLACQSNSQQLYKCV